MSVYFDAIDKILDPLATMRQCSHNDDHKRMSMISNDAQIGRLNLS